MSKTLIVPDIHLGKSLSIGKPSAGAMLNSRFLDQLKLLDWILDQAIENDVTTIICTGDVCEDIKPDWNILINLIRWLKKCEVYNIDVHIVAGNHDIKRSGNYYTSPLDIISSSEISNVFFHKDITTIYNGDVAFTLMPFRDRRSFNTNSTLEALRYVKDLILWENNSISNSYEKVLIGHLALEGSIFVGDEIDDTLNELMCPLSIFEGYDYVWMGHVHKPQVKSIKPHIAHIGSLDLSDFGETDHTKILILFDSNSDNKFKEIKVPSRPLKRIRATFEYGVDPTVEILKLIEVSNLKDAIVKIEIQLIGPDILNVNRKQIEEAIYKKGAYHISNLSETRSVSVVPIEKQKVDNTIEPLSAIKMYVKQLSLLKEDEVLFIETCKETIEEVQ